MKVCFVVSTYPPGAGGQGEVVLNLQNRFLECSVDAHVLTSGTNISGYPQTVRTRCGKRLFYVMSLRHIDWIRRMDFDVINVHQESGMAIMPLLATIKGHSKIVTTIHTPYFSESRALRRLRLGQTEITRPTLDECFARHVLTPVKFLGTYLDCKLSDRIVAVCQRTKEECKRDCRISDEDISVIPNGVDLSRFSPKISGARIRDKYSLRDRPVVLSVGCGTIRKGTAYLLYSMRDVKVHVPDAVLIVVGPTKYLDQLRTIAKELSIAEDVIFSGHVGEDELPQYYSAADVVAVPSLQEGFPCVVLEGMASGKPVVASRVGGIPEAIESNKNGILFDPGNVNQLAEALVCLLENESLRKKMGMEGRHVAETRYDWQDIASMYLSEFKSLL